MKYKRMVVWSGGSHKAKTAKINAICSGIASILLCIIHILAFVYIPDAKDNTTQTLFDHMIFGIACLFFLGWLTLSMVYMTKESIEAIRNNKLISLYLYNMESFARIVFIPHDKFILFADDCGVVLADRKYIDESKYFCFGVKYFYKFEDYYEKHAVEKEEIEIK